MIKLHIENGHCETDCCGNRITLLTDLTIGCARILYKMFEDCPSEGLRDIMLKTFFENVLSTMHEMGKEEG